MKKTTNIKRKIPEGIESKFDLFFKKKNLIILTTILVLNLIFNFLLFDPKLFTGGDNAVYITLAQSILSGKGYRNISNPAEPQHSQYPPGLPLLIVPILFLFGNNYIIMKIMVILMGSGALFFLWKLLQKYTVPAVTVCVVLITAFHPDLIEFSHWVLTEIPYLFFTILGTFLLVKFLESDSHNFKYLIFAAVGFVYSFYIRPTGSAILGAGFIALLLRKKYKYLAIYLVIILLLILPWLIRNAKIGVPILGQSQGAVMLRTVYDLEGGRMTFSELIQRIFGNIKIYSLNIIPATLFPIFNITRIPILINAILILMTISLAIYGFFYQIRKRISIIHIYFLFYFIVILPWHEYVSTVRYFLPVMPFFFYFFIFGLIQLNKKIALKKHYLFLTMIVLFIIITEFSLIIRKSPNSLANLSAYIHGDIDAGYSEDWIRYYQAADWLRKNSPENSVVITRKPELFYLRAKRKTLIYPYTHDHDKMKEFIFQSKVDYIVVDQFYWTGTTGKYLVPVINENMDKFEVVFRTPPPETYVLKIKR
jgi:hypothetical protein